MKRLLIVLLCLSGVCLGQGARLDSHVTTSSTDVPWGASAPLYTVPYSMITICAYPNNGEPCTNTVPIFQDPALTIPQANPIESDNQGRFGFWVTPGQYSYSIVSPTGKYMGTFITTIAGGGGGGGGNVVGQLNRVGSFSDPKTTKPTNATVDNTNNQFTFPALTAGNGTNQPFTFNQVCSNPTQIAPNTNARFICNLWTGTANQNVNVGQAPVGYYYAQNNYNIVGRGHNPGTNGSINSFQEHTGGGPYYNFQTFQRGNHAGMNLNMFCIGGGDCQSANINVAGACNASSGADEGCAGIREEIQQFGPLAGTIQSGGTLGSTQINTNINGYFSDQGYVYDSSSIVGTATINSTPINHNEINALEQTISGFTLVPSTAWGKMQPASVSYPGNPVVGMYQNYVTVTANILLGTSPASPGPFTVGAMTCAGHQIEYMQITAVGAPSGGLQSVTFRSRNAWDATQGNSNPAACFQGGNMDGKAFIGTAVAASNPALYPILGALDATTMVFANCVTGNCNGNLTGNLLPYNSGITIVPYAEIIGTANGSLGVAELGYNNVNWANGHTVWEASPVQGVISGGHINVRQISRLVANSQGLNGIIQQGSEGLTVGDLGFNPIAVGYRLFNARQTGNAPVDLPLAAFGIQGIWQNGMVYQTTPPSGGAMLAAIGANGEGSSFTGSISGGILTVTSMTSGSIIQGQELLGAGVPSPCEVFQMVPNSGTLGGVAQYQISNCGNPTVAAGPMTTVKGDFYVFNVGVFGGESNTSYKYNATTHAATLNVANSTGPLSIVSTTVSMNASKALSYGSTIAANTDSAIQVALTGGSFTYTTVSLYLNHPICGDPSYLGSAAGSTTTGKFGLNWVGANGGTNTTPNTTPGAWTLTGTATAGANATVNLTCIVRP
jgi:hypothetical protein